MQEFFTTHGIRIEKFIETFFNFENVPPVLDL